MTKKQIVQLLGMLDDIRQDQRMILEKQTSILEDLAEIKARQQWIEEEMSADARDAEGFGMRQVFLN